MSPDTPAVSLGLPVCNGEKYLSLTIDSLLNQTFCDFELVISDNGSTDRTQEICEAYAAKDDRIRYYRSEENRGLAWNFTRVFELARGKYFKWAAHDDQCSPTFVERCVDVLDADASIVLCHPRAEYIDASGQLKGELPFAPGLDSPDPTARFDSVLRNVDWCIELYGLIRRDALRDTKLLRTFSGGDKVCVAEVSLVGRFAEIPETLFFFRTHAQQYSHLPTAAEQQQAMHGGQKRRFAIPRVLRMSWGLFWVIPKARIPWTKKFACMLSFGRYLCQVTKWRKVINEMFRGRGCSGVDPKILRKQRTQSEHSASI